MLGEYQVRLAIKKFAFVVIILSLCTSCMHNPYVNRTVVEADGTEVKKFFAYGHFCGSHHPVLRSESEERVVLTDLSDLPTPIDDLDEVCFLHDLCHQSNYPNVDSCDFTFEFILYEAIEQSPDERCKNLMYDMSAAMFTTRQNRLSTTPVLFGDAGFMGLHRLWRELTNETDEFPEEGTCNFTPLHFLGDPSKPDLLEDFRRAIEVSEFAKQAVDDPESLDLEPSIVTDD